jgi:uncharacterized membrane protein YphA (DoxX/SURF4 family)
MNMKKLAILVLSLIIALSFMVLGCQKKQEMAPAEAPQTQAAPEKQEAAPEKEAMPAEKEAMPAQKEAPAKKAGGY